MTSITVQDGQIVLRDGAVGTGQACCCGCAACPYCSSGCVQVVLSDWSGSASGCDCADINGTYLLSRGAGAAPTATVTVTDSTGSGAVIQVTLAFNPATGTYFVASTTVVSAGDDYSSEASATVNIFGGTVECDKNPQLTLERENVEPTTDFFLDVNDAFGGAGDALTVVWAPENTTPGSETWKVGSVAVLNGGTGFDLWQAVSIPSSLINDPIRPVDSGQSSIIGFTSVDRAEPVISSFSVVDIDGNPSGGSGASFSVVWEIDDAVTDFLDSVQPGADNRFWRVASAAVISGGSGYAAGDRVRYALSGRHVDYSMANSADADYELAGLTVVAGEVTAVDFSLGSGPNLAKSNGTIQSVVITQPGEWYQQSGITGVIIDNPGSIVASGGSVDLPEGALPGCAYTRCEEITCGEETACVSVSLVATDESHVLTVAVNGETVASASKPSSDSSCSSIEFSSGDFTSAACTAGSASVSSAACDTGPQDDACCEEPCSGPCEDNEDCAPGCRCVDGECVGEEPCSGPCDEENPCPEGCACVDGECETEAACCDALESLCLEFTDIECADSNECPDGYTCAFGTCERFFEELGDCPEGTDTVNSGTVPCTENLSQERCENAYGTYRAGEGCIRLPGDIVVCSDFEENPLP